MATTPSRRRRRRLACPQYLPAILAMTFCIADVRAELVVHEAWMGEVPPSSRVGAIYLDIENAGSEPATITKASSALAERVEMHRSVTEGDRVRMQPQPAIVLAPGERLNFIVTGDHFMLFFAAGVKAPGLDSRLPLTLGLANGDRVEVEARVRAAADTGAAAAGSHDHHHH